MVKCMVDTCYRINEGDCFNLGLTDILTFNYCMVENLPPKVRAEEMTTAQGKKYSNIRYAPESGS